MKNKKIVSALDRIDAHLDALERELYMLRWGANVFERKRGIEVTISSTSDTATRARFKKRRKK